MQSQQGQSSTSFVVNVSWMQHFDGGLKVTDMLRQSVAENDAQTAPSTAPSLPESSASLRWAFINGWKVESQSDDRAPMFGAVAPSTASPSARRSSARRKHQAMFKEWSQDRHD
ncbi:MAG: hypothetical protein M3R52_09855 [Acidobacteriota bacterium]|nr:hypothetical protein [Acidobacteriota bacterium]